MSKVFTIAEGLENLGALRTGGQGSVYKGKRLGEIITAVKILPTPILSEDMSDRNYRTFKNEVEKLKKVNEVPNPNVVKIMNYGLTESGSFPFIEMDYIEGPDLGDLLKPPHEPVFTIRETIKVAEHLASALAHCHKVGVKHGDIKSNNVKFNTATGNYILFDFGLSIMSDEQRRSSIRYAGAVEFMAPEQHDGEMFFQTDVYSYGVILYELLAGSVPFPQINNSETHRNAVMLSHMEKPVPDLLDLRRQNIPEGWSAETKAEEMNVPARLLNLIRKCLEKLPEKRYADGMALQNALIHHRELVAPPMETPGMALPEPEEASPEAVRVSKPIFYVMVLALVALTLFAAYSIYLNDINQRQLAYYTDSLSNTPDTTSLVAETIPEDTVNTIKPIITDTAALQGSTDVDSLKQIYEAQMGAEQPTEQQSAIPKENTSKNKDIVLVSEGVRYQLPKGTLFFYDAPQTDASKRGVFGLWTMNKFSVVDEQNGFIYVTHTNNDGEVTKGWLNKADLKEVP
ncbi:serine/threonine protein kinase [Pedobacter deserti]|uniref:serine/threonine protein kinase n=1 Tax=Pedobacter deserti TaxID=2817382 RepID=UPI0021087FF4|nr:serine/threonine-protein kinase [Pedobacter sp. SYSU D00382]